jgi:hypothetical protein
VICYYHVTVLPILIAWLLVAAVVSLGSIRQSQGQVINFNSSSSSASHIARKEEHSSEYMTLRVQTQLLVAGVLSCFVCLFQIISFVATRSLYSLMSADDIESYGWLYGYGGGEGGKLTMQRLRQRDALLLGLHNHDLSKQKLIGKLHFQNRPRPKWERWVMGWAVAMSMYHIYFNGTFAIFAGVISESDTNGTSNCARYAYAVVARLLLADLITCSFLTSLLANSTANLRLCDMILLCSIT